MTVVSVEKTACYKTAAREALIEFLQLKLRRSGAGETYHLQDVLLHC